MLYFDTHAHYDWQEFDKDRRKLFDKFNETLCGLVNIGINLDSAMKVKEYSNEYSNMYYSVGIHPMEVEKKTSLDQIEHIFEDELKNNVTVSSVKDTEIIKITVTTKEPVNSVKIANEIAKVFTEKVKEIYSIENVQVVDKAEISYTPSNINHKKDIIIFAFIGAVVSVIYVLLSNMLDTTVKTAEEIEKEFKLPVIASIPIYNAEPQRRNGGKR